MKYAVCAFNFSNDIEPTSSIPKIGFDGLLGWLVKGKLVSRLMINKEASSTEDVKSDLSGEDEFFEIKLPITKETKSLDDASFKNIQRLEEIGRKYIADNNKLIQKLCDNLLDNLNKEQMINQTIDLIDGGFEGSDEIELEKEELLTDVKKILNEFSEKNPELKEDIEQFLQKAENYTLEEIKGCIVSFEQASSKWQEEQNKEDMLSSCSMESCSMEALKEDMSPEGEEHTDDALGYNEIVA